MGKFAIELVFVISLSACGGAAIDREGEATEASAPTPAINPCGSCTNDYRLPLGCGGATNAATVSCPSACKLTGAWWYQDDGGTCVEADGSGTWCCSR